MKEQFFIPGKISVILDSSSGSSGKGKIGSYITKENVGKYHFVCNTFSTQASHFVFDKNYPEFCYKQFNSCAHRHEEFEKMYIGHGAVITLKALFEEIKKAGIPINKVGISPLCGICQDNDRLYEEGKVDLAGNPMEHSGTISNGSTCSGVGAVRARRVLRDKNILLAKDVPELKDMICDVPREILDRLSRGQAGLLEVAQGFQLSNGYQFYPNCTARNVTVVGALDDMFLPVTVVGNVMLNLRTFPIRIASKKYVATGNMTVKLPNDIQAPSHAVAALTDIACRIANVNPANVEKSIVLAPMNSPTTSTNDFCIKVVMETNLKGKHLTHDEIKSGFYEFEEVDSYSGDGYDDQQEITWADVEKGYGKTIPDDIKLTSLTKLMRRVFTYSQKNLEESIIYNQTPYKVFLSLNFVNWIDGSIEGKTKTSDIKHPIDVWVLNNIQPVINKFSNVKLVYLGTGRYTEDTIDLSYIPD